MSVKKDVGEYIVIINTLPYLKMCIFWLLLLFSSWHICCHGWGWPWLPSSFFSLTMFSITILQPYLLLLSISWHSFQISLNTVLPSHFLFSLTHFSLFWHLISASFSSSILSTWLVFLPTPRQFLLKTFLHSNLRCQFVHSLCSIRRFFLPSYFGKPALSVFKCRLRTNSYKVQV